MERVLGLTDQGLAEDATAASESDSGPSATEPQALPEGVRPLALVVDDDGSNRLVVSTLLRHEGYEVVEAADGEAAVHTLRLRPEIALVILDLDMPIMGGMEVLERIRGRVSTAALPVVVLTGKTDSAVEMKVLEGGADDYLRKPIEPRMFSLRVRSVLRRTGADSPRATV